jgi:hypothetical protein
VAAGPMLNGRISVAVGATVERDGFAYADLIPSPTDQNPWAHWRNPMDMMRHG